LRYGNGTVLQLVVPCSTVVACVFQLAIHMLLYHHTCLQAGLYIAFLSVFAVCEKLCRVTSVNPPVRWYDSTPTAQIFLNYCGNLLKSAKKIQVWLKSEEYITCFTRRLSLIYDNMSLISSWMERSFW